MSQQDTFTTIHTSGEALFKDKGSKFYGYAYHACTVDDVKELVHQLKNEHHQARHWCYGYILDLDGKITRANDDGEPGLSAGTPILNQIKSAELVQTLVVVVRYFGGTKLGVSGLINAYKTAAELAIENATNKTVYKTKSVQVSVPFDYLNLIMRLTKRDEVSILNQEYGNQVTIDLQVRAGMFDAVLHELNGIHQATVKVSDS